MIHRLISGKSAVLGGLVSAGLASAVLLPAGPARAGAWTLAEGTGQLIVTSGREMAPASAFFDGIADSDTSTLRVHLEYGLTPEVTLGLTASGEWMLPGQQVDLRLGAHARYRIWQGRSGDVASIQIGGSFPVEQWFGEPGAGGSADSVAEAQAGLLYGRSWQTGWGDTFATGGLALRWRGGDQADEVLIEATAGHRPIKRLLGLFSIYAAAPMGDGDFSLKLAPSLAWTFWPYLGENEKKPAVMHHPRTIQLGVSYDVLAPEDGLAVNLSVWNRF